MTHGRHRTQPPIEDEPVWLRWFWRAYERVTGKLT